METPERPPQPTLGQLVGQVQENLSNVVRNEIALAKAQFTEKARNTGVAIGMFAAAGVIAIFAVAWLIHAGYNALQLVVPAWAAALIVGGALLLLVALLVGVGAALLKRGKVPDVKLNLEEDVAAVKAGIQR